MSEVDQDGGRKAVWNVAGGVIGALLAALAILGIVSVQSSVKQPQTSSEVISYDG